MARLSRFRHSPPRQARPSVRAATAPVESAPVESAPVESAPVEPAPVEPAPVEPAPESALVLASLPAESAEPVVPPKVPLGRRNKRP